MLTKVGEQELQENIPGLANGVLEIIDEDKMVLDLALFQTLTTPAKKKVNQKSLRVLSSLLEYMKRYLDLIISMFEGRNDESINQIKNIGFSEAFCRDFLDGPIVEVLKIKVWRIFLNIYLKFPKTVCTDMPVFFEYSLLVFMDSTRSTSKNPWLTSSSSTSWKTKSPPNKVSARV